jgi:hypothetical protein
MKKIIAKEFLILLSVISISLITFPITYGYNTYLSNKKEILEDSIQNTTFLWKENYNSLRNSYNKKYETQKTIFRTASNYYNNVGYNKEFYSSYYLWNNFKSRLKNQSSTMLYNDYKDFILFHNNYFYVSYEDKIPNNAEGFFNFIKYNLLTEEDIENNKLSWEHQSYRYDIEQRINELFKKMLNKKAQIKIALNSFYILFSIAFILRFLVISIKWSIKELKS